MADLSRYVVTGNVPDNLVKSPAFLEGRFGADVYEAYQREKAVTYQGNPNLKLSQEKGVIVGSNFFDSVLVNQLLKNGRVQGNPRTALPADLINPEVLVMIKGSYYVDSQALVLRGTADSVYPKNEPLVRFLAEQKGVDLSRLEREPALMYGFDLKLDESGEGYGLLAVPNKDFTILHDDRLAGKWNEYKFDTVDEKGLPVDLDERNGSRVWYTRKDGLSGLYLDGGLDLSSGWNDLDDSGLIGRVVILSGEATVPEKT
ncbi:MAG: hypothetical protein ABIH25_04200 [Candidatus Woesearchaeota archaeon]